MRGLGAQALRSEQPVQLPPAPLPPHSPTVSSALNITVTAAAERPCPTHQGHSPGDAASILLSTTHAPGLSAAVASTQLVTQVSRGPEPPRSWNRAQGSPWPHTHPNGAEATYRDLTPIPCYPTPVSVCLEIERALRLYTKTDLLRQVCCPPHTRVCHPTAHSFTPSSMSEAGGR